ncbi:phospholipid carrier-dependent glycosyltransferase [candidate division WWE3 bacterium]|uniref:Phospholipid carrier-dependent glycosyltransferase n=1 Tax=candidate division WWE3 bacterium TaxID=2053526 RepID=A0A7X9DK27_UNCKA|nr:phospholipid carrier-dependent glycosyltransferase [candidate division WWE3 bacterium]
MGKLHVVFIILSLLLLGTLRFWNLSYSEYIPDETTVVTPVKRQQILNQDFLSSQRKGPIQFLVAYGVSLFGISVNNEFLYRFPFAVASTVSLIFIYLSIYELSGKRSVALVSALLIGINGFVVAFGRIVQYQSFNLFFSFMALYFYAKILRNSASFKRTFTNTIMGLLFLFLSLASHWDALFFVPAFLYIFVSFCKNNWSDKKLIKSFLLIHLCVFLLVFVPFVLIYLRSFLSSQTHQSYFEGRVGFMVVNLQLLISKFTEFIDKDRLYQPLYFLEFVASLAALGLLTIKKTWPILLWFLFCVFIFIFTVKKPGTHLYNIYIPLSIFAAYGFWVITRLFRNWFIVIPSVLFLIPISFFSYQNYLLFIDSSVEYPWDQETIYKTITQKYVTKKYDQISLSNNIIGFPLNRHWEEINKIILDDIKKSGNTPEQFSYITNEVKSVSAFYMDIPYGSSSNMYAVGIKRPFSFEQDYSFPQFHNRRTISKIEYKGSMVARIYKIDQK